VRPPLGQGRGLRACERDHHGADDGQEHPGDGTTADDAEYSLTLSRLPDRDGTGVRLFLDLQCRETTGGREFCAGPRVKKVRGEFRAAVTAP